MLKWINKVGNRYSHHLIGLVLFIWILLLVLPSHYLGENYFLRNKILMDIFPIIGYIFIVLSALCKNITYLIVGISLIFAFYITMMVGYLLIGV